MTAGHCALLIAVTLLMEGPARGHGSDPAGVHVREAEGGAVTVRIVTAGPKAPAMDVAMPPGCRLLETAQLPGTDGHWTLESRWACDAPLAGRSLRIEGLGGAAVVRAELLDGRVHRGVVTAEAPVMPIPSRGPSWKVLLSYGELGLRHLVSGLDHLFFVSGLVLVARRFGRTLRALTAFTLGHSVTLCAAALGYVAFPARLAEVGIAASLLWLAVSVARGDRAPRGLSRAAFSLGLLHGLGFASALAETGLPEGEIAPALLGFNLGIEAGQAAVVGAMWLLWIAAARLGVEARPRQRGWMGHALGAVAGMWCIERLFALLS